MLFRFTSETTLSHTHAHRTPTRNLHNLSDKRKKRTENEYIINDSKFMYTDRHFSPLIGLLLLLIVLRALRKVNKHKNVCRIFSKSRKEEVGEAKSK